MRYVSRADADRSQGYIDAGSENGTCRSRHPSGCPKQSNPNSQKMGGVCSAIVVCPLFCLRFT